MKLICLFPFVLYSTFNVHVHPVGVEHVSVCMFIVLNYVEIIRFSNTA